MQETVWLVTVALMAGATGVFIWIATTAENGVEDYGPMVASLYRLRPWLFGIAAIVLIVSNYKALTALPYVSRPGVGPVQPVEVLGEQWSWTIKPSEVVAGRPVEFHVTSKDVNHGFAIYNQGLQIVAQTQAMPRYVNVLRYTFDEPGIYRIMCLEYCGSNHHEMQAEITVVAASAQAGEAR